MCYVPQHFLVDKISAMPYGGCLWYLEHGMGRMRLDYMSGRPMLGDSSGPYGDTRVSDGAHYTNGLAAWLSSGTA